MIQLGRKEKKSLVGIYTLTAIQMLVQSFRMTLEVICQVIESQWYLGLFGQVLQHALLLEQGVLYERVHQAGSDPLVLR